jgi:2'-5' RNA ligase
LRQQHFPPARNFLPAHITLFHALPGEQKISIQQTLQALCSRRPVLSLTFPKVRSLGKGVAITVESPELIQLHQHLAKTWQAWLSRQDQQRYQPHITIQNKVTPDAAQQLHQQLAGTWQLWQGYGEGLLLWYYQGGPWELAHEFAFS